MQQHARFALSALALALLNTAQAADPSLTVTEFYAPANKRYFMTAYPEETASLNANNNASGWYPTGISFKAFKANEGAGATAVYRFYSPTANTHFYTSNVPEAEGLRTDKVNWRDEGVAYYLNVAAAAGCADTQVPIYRVYNDGFAKKVPVNHRFTPDLTIMQKQATANKEILEGLAFCAPMSEAQKRQDAVRFLWQSSFGPNDTEISKVQSIGPAAYLQEQLNMAAVSKYTPRDYYPQARPDTCVDDRTVQPTQPNSMCARDNYSTTPVQKEFYSQALQNQDQLRQRMGWVWSQFFVISALDNILPYGMGDYQQMLRDGAFGNFKTLLKSVTLHGAMGRYLDMGNNQKPTATNTPNENYAREILQLFSIGTNELKADGTPLLDAAGKTIPTYTNEEIEGYAHVFTGWTYPNLPGNTTTNRLNGPNYKGSMVERSTYHDMNSKLLLDEKTAAANLTMSADLDNALQTIFDHANVPPFVSRFLIQKLVTGEPSPEYVARVSAVFKNNGSGVRGDIKAVVSAILLDPEARGFAKLDPNYGHLREPVLHITRMARGLNVKSDGVPFIDARGGNKAGAMGQPVFSSPSVFNYYPPEHVIAKNGINSPEFNIFNASFAFNRANIVNNWVLGNNIAADNTYYQSTGTQFDWTTLSAAAANTETLLDKVNELYFAGSMSAAVRSAIKTAVEAVASSNPLQRAKTAVALAVNSPQSQIER
jgi:uncharacterized protein (DUF1800 family)